MAEIHLKNLAHSYLPHPSGPSDYALKKIDHVWEDGKAYALLGPSGCGKSTLLNIISGLLTPSEGSVLFDGEDVTNLPTEKRHIAQVFQFPVVYDTMTVYDNLAFPLKNRGHDAKTIDQRVRDIAEMLEMTGELNKKARGLTADAKQKISLGRGLVRQNVSAILFDEPLTVIDPHLKWMLRMQLKALHKKTDRTMIYVTHDQTEALTFADKVVVMYEGDVVQMGTPQELFERPQHTFVGYFIGSPGMNVIPAHVEGNQAHIEGTTIQLNYGYKGMSGSNVEIGVRPEFTSLHEGGEGLPITIKRVEDVGRYKIVRADFFGREINITVPEGQPISERVNRVSFDPTRVNVYQGGWIVDGEAA
ncbi:ABC transporter ATP-binding protein [Terasakiella pusilla]|uniref:ABC transporter ATP-binding protein n=1 Tax=Terasakiella pusilla TaxID=64973 RepID=UPI00048C3C94|nr:ABC transporter ATP-binding protein [Terasakiella pusilla]